jgi:hypothetical protein|tara:strand:+ start:544 stop:711 length:168 start_codon:yes stop_codon:yes gene_type:complete
MWLPTAGDSPSAVSVYHVIHLSEHAKEQLSELEANVIVLQSEGQSETVITPELTV